MIIKNDKTDEITSEEKIEIEYSEETQNTKIELTEYIYDEFEKLVKAGIISANDFNAKMYKVSELIISISSKASSDGFIQGFKMGHEFALYDCTVED
jgi:hypothetical protein